MHQAKLDEFCSADSLMGASQEPSQCVAYGVVRGAFSVDPHSTKPIALPDSSKALRLRN